MAEGLIAHRFSLPRVWGGDKRLAAMLPRNEPHEFLDRNG